MLDPNEGTVIMGVLNVTPDSFSDGGKFYDVDSAIAEGLRMTSEGAHLVDVGGQSTRPGSAGVDSNEELMRVIPVIEGLAAGGAAVSVDTSKPDVAERAIGAGAVVVNDVGGFRTDGLAQVCAEGGVGVVIMHMLGDPRTMQENPTYQDVVTEIRDYLVAGTDALSQAGVDIERVAIDPGIGFGKTLDHNLTLLNRLDVFAATGRPVVVGTSRKSFLGSLTGRYVDERDVATAVSVGHSIAGGASIIRVHNVPYAADAAALTDAMVKSRDFGDVNGDGDRTQTT